MKLSSGSLKRIHVNMHVIARNRKEGRSDPPITVKCKGRNYRALELDIVGDSQMIYSPHKPLLQCGARLILETRSAVVIRRK